MDLKEAIQIETCKDYEKDLQDEYYQLSMRYKRLKATVDRWDKRGLITSPESIRSIYDMQLGNESLSCNVVRKRSNRRR